MEEGRRYLSNEKETHSTLSLLLQGGWEDDESVEEAACREALEEAGVRGVLNVRSLFLLRIPEV